MSKNSKNNSSINLTADKRKERVEKNRIRTMKHVHRLLNQISDGASHGYNHLAWEDAAEAYRQVSTFLSPNEYHNIGKAWSESYVQDHNGEELRTIIQKIRDRFVY